MCEDTNGHLMYFFQTDKSPTQCILPGGNRCAKGIEARVRAVLAMDKTQYQMDDCRAYFFTASGPCLPHIACADRLCLLFLAGTSNDCARSPYPSFSQTRTGNWSSKIWGSAQCRAQEIYCSLLPLQRDGISVGPIRLGNTSRSTYNYRSTNLPSRKVYVTISLRCSLGY